MTKYKIQVIIEAGPVFCNRCHFQYSDPHDHCDICTLFEGKFLEHHKHKNIRLEECRKAGEEV